MTNKPNNPATPAERHVQVELGERSYGIDIGPGLLGQLGPIARQLVPAKRCAIISDQTVADLHGPTAVGVPRAGRLPGQPAALPARRRQQEPRHSRETLRRAGRRGHRTVQPDRHAGRRGDRRPGRLRRRHVAARRAVHPGPDHPGGRRRRQRRRQGGRQPRQRQEHDRRVLPAAPGRDRRGRACGRCPSANLSLAWARASSTA